MARLRQFLKSLKPSKKLELKNMGDTWVTAKPLLEIDPVCRPQGIRPADGAAREQGREDSQLP